MKTQIEWPIAFFDDDYLRIYKPMLTPDRTEKEVEFIASSLGLPKGARVLDLACGFGRHAIGMAQRGYKVVGLDFNPNYLEIGEAQAREAHVEVEWREGDMRRLPFTSEFDGVYSFFTSFGYFSDVENEDVLAGVGRALEPGGCFLLDLMNRDWLLTHPPQRTWTEREDGGLLMEEVSIDLPSSRVSSRQILVEKSGDARPTKEYILRAYTCAELTALLARHGLRVDKVVGSAEGIEYSTESRRLIIIAHRRD